MKNRSHTILHINEKGKAEGPSVTSKTSPPKKNHVTVDSLIAIA